MLHGFQAGRGTGTASLKANILQQLIEIREEVLYEVFLNLRKAYDALGRKLCMWVLMVYEVGPRTERILQHYWDHISMVDRAGRSYGPLLKGHQGVTQGDPISLIIF